MRNSVRRIALSSLGVMACASLVLSQPGSAQPGPGNGPPANAGPSSARVRAASAERPAAAGATPGLAGGILEVPDDSREEIEQQALGRFAPGVRSGLPSPESKRSA